MYHPDQNSQRSRCKAQPRYDSYDEHFALHSLAYQARTRQDAHLLPAQLWGHPSGGGGQAAQEEEEDIAQGSNC